MNTNIVSRLLKYVIMGLIIVIATRYIPDQILSIKELVMISLTSVIAFAVLDSISPSVQITQTQTKSKVILEE
jgi:uncharacterized membrane protein